MRPKLKETVWERVGDDLHVVADSLHIVLADQSGEVSGLLELLREGSRSYAELAEAVAIAWPSVPAVDVDQALHELDRLGLMVDADGDDGDLTDWQHERFTTNLEYFENFASLTRSAASFQRELLNAHVVFLGIGGLGCAALPAVAGCGVSRMTLVDCDVVELKNFNRQYLYRESDVGRRKAERAAAWVRAFNSSADLRVLDREISAAQDVAELLPDADLVISCIDTPYGVDLMVNEACLAAGVPFVHGGLQAKDLSYGSVDPGNSACLACAGDAREADPVVTRLAARLSLLNRTVGPAISMLGGLVTMEALRYLTRFSEPIAAGCDRFTDLTTGAERVRRWERRPDCPACASVPHAVNTQAPQPTAAPDGAGRGH
jgi:molybdopterin-synthase adenylyltransferase